MNRYFLGTFLSLCIIFYRDLSAATNSSLLQPVITSTPLSSTSPANPPTSEAQPSPQQNTTAATNTPTLIIHDLPEIHGKIALPKEWTLLPGKLLEGDVLLATREKISNENDPWATGLSMTIDRNGAKDSKLKASAYALSLANEAREKAGEEASPLKESQVGSFHEIRFDFPVASELPLQVTEVLRANDATGTLAVILWQMPKREISHFQKLRDAILAGLTLDPTQ